MASVPDLETKKMLLILLQGTIPDTDLIGKSLQLNFVRILLT